MATSGIVLFNIVQTAFRLDRIAFESCFGMPGLPGRCPRTEGADPV